MRIARACVAELEKPGATDGADEAVVHLHPGDERLEEAEDLLQALPEEPEEIVDAAS